MLGFENQLIIVGFMLSVMNLCLMRVMPTLLLIIESRWGHSSLQDFEAILRNSVASSETRAFWRTVLLTLVALPLGLSVAYKKFIGGTSSAPIHSMYNGHYGTAPLPMGNASAVTNPLYLAFNTTIPFSITSTSDNSPPWTDLPAPYGYSTLLLSNTSAAILDVPTPDYLQSIQQNLSESESWYLSATVNGTVTTFDASVTQYRENDTFWNQIFNSSESSLYTGGGLSSWGLFNGWDLGAIFGFSSDPVSAFCVAGFYMSNASGDNYGDTYGETTFYRSNDSDSQNFRKTSLLFHTVRQRCTGQWEITRSNVRLSNGSCSGVLTNQTVLRSAVPFLLDAMPIMVHALTDYSPGGSRNSSEWLMPTFVVNIAAAQWSRIIWLNGNSLAGHTYQPPKGQPEMYYPAEDESITSTVATLDADWRLYFVLAVQPVLTVVCFLVVGCLYHHPIGKGFGLVAILAGMDLDGLALLRGAAFSGKLTRPVRMDISVHDNSKGPDTTGGGFGRIRYSLDQNPQERTGRLQKKRIYG
jgi:hypothetical protein